MPTESKPALKPEPTIDERLAALGIPAVDDYLRAIDKGVHSLDLCRLQGAVIAALVASLESALAAKGKK